MTNCEKFVNDLVSKVVTEWWQMQCQDPCSEVFCYYRQGDALASLEQPDEYELAMNERLSPAWDKQVCARKIREALYRVPCLPVE